MSRLMAHNEEATINWKNLFKLWYNIKQVIHNSLVLLINNIE